MEEFYKKYFNYFNQIQIDCIFDYDDRIITGDDWIDFKIWQNYHNNQFKIWKWFGTKEYDYEL